MIIGIGTDLCHIPRMQALLERFGERFERKLFTVNERERAAHAKNSHAKAAIYAKRFAAKEAFVKAIGTGFGKGIYYHAIEVQNQDDGKPFIRTNAAVHQLLKKRLHEGHNPMFHLSLSDDGDYASAFVVVELL